MSLMKKMSLSFHYFIKRNLLSRKGYPKYLSTFKKKNFHKDNEFHDEIEFTIPLFHQTKFTSKQKLGNDLHSTGMQFKGGIPNTRKIILSQRKKFLSPSVNISIRLKVKIRIIKFVVRIIDLTCDISAARQYMFFVLQYTVKTQHDFIAMETRLGCHKYKPDSVILVTTQ